MFLNKDNLKRWERVGSQIESMRHGFEAILFQDVPPSLYYRERQSRSLYGFMSLLAGFQSVCHAMLSSAMLQKHQHTDYSTIQRDFRTRSALPLHCLFPWEVYSCKPHIALLEQLEVNSQYHLNHLKWDFSSHIYMAQSKVEHRRLFCKLGLYRQPELDDSACHNSQLHFIFQDALRLNPLSWLKMPPVQVLQLCQHHLQHLC